MTDAIQLIRDDHIKVKQLFKAFDRAKDDPTKKTVADDALLELDVHAQLVEQTFYRVVRARVKGEEDQEMMLKADEEHHVSKVLIDELMDMTLSDSHYVAKFAVLAENVKQHIEVEEGQLFAAAKNALNRDELKKLGEAMAQRKEEIVTEIAQGRRGAPNGRANRSIPSKRKSPTPRAQSHSPVRAH